MKRLLMVVTLLGLSSDATAFEVKGYTPGMEITKANLQGCQKMQDVSDGIPGYRCDTTLGGDKAVLSLAVVEGKVAAVVFDVAKGRMGPVLDALIEKFGRASTGGSRESMWYREKGKEMYSMTLRERSTGSGYRLYLLDLPLLEKAQSAAAKKAKKDL